MTLVQLRYFVAIADAGFNITSAAEHVHATQPGLSKQLKQLEDELGFLLFVRKGRSLEELTPAGAQQIDYVYSLLLGWIVDKLARSPSYQGRPDRRAVETALEHIAHRVLTQRDWHDDTPSTVALPAGAGGKY